jgi:hypothetical protein
MASTGQSVGGVEEQAACQAVREAAREGDMAALTRLLGVEPDGQGQTRGGSDLESMRHRAMLTAADDDGESALILAAEKGDVNVMRLLLDHPSADAAAQMMHATNFGTTALMFAAQEGLLDAVRVLLYHPSADAGAMMMLTTNEGSTALMFAARNGMLDAMRLLLEHPSSDPAEMIAARSTNGISALTAAACFAAGQPITSSRAHTRSCAPLLLLLRRVAVEPQPCAAQQAHMTEVMEALCWGLHEDEDEEGFNLFDDDRPDGVRDECVRMLVERGARALADIPAVWRIIQECVQLARVPQLVNEAIVGLAVARQQDQKPRDNA